MQYCTTILISEHIRLDLFTAEMFRVRVSALPGEKFPEKYEIPFAVGRTSPWEAVEYRADGETDSTMVAVRTEKFDLRPQGYGGFYGRDLAGQTAVSGGCAPLRHVQKSLYSVRRRKLLERGE